MLKYVQLTFAKTKYPIIGIGMKLTRKFHGIELPGKVKIAVAGCKMLV